MNDQTSTLRAAAESATAETGGTAGAIQTVVPQCAKPLVQNLVHFNLDCLDFLH